MNDFYISCLIKIAFAFVAGFILGVERKFRQQVVGMRTLILICESAVMLSILSGWITNQIGSADNARIAAGVISGIGFLGAGVIMKQGLNIKGITSAAIIWADATIGLCIGAGLFVPTFIMLGVTVISLISLISASLRERAAVLCCPCEPKCLISTPLMQILMSSLCGPFEVVR